MNKTRKIQTTKAEDGEIQAADGEILAMHWEVQQTKMDLELQAQKEDGTLQMMEETEEETSKEEMDRRDKCFLHLM